MGTWCNLRANMYRRRPRLRDGRLSCALGLAAMLKKLLPTNGYRRKLARVIVLADGTELVTLRDAANVLLDVFGSVNARSSVPDNATRLLLIAARRASVPTLRPRQLRSNARSLSRAAFADRSLGPGIAAGAAAVILTKDLGSG